MGLIEKEDEIMRWDMDEKDDEIMIWDWLRRRMRS